MKKLLTFTLALAAFALCAVAQTSTIEGLTDATTISASDKVWLVDVDGTPKDVDATLEQIVSPFAADPSSSSAFDAVEWAADLNITSAWGDITGTPTTLSGYGIIDAATAAQGALADSAVQPGDGIEITELNFPNLTTSELDAVTDAIAGDTYFDSDRGQFVRFTGSASYDVITSRSSSIPDNSSASSAISLQDSRFFESGLIQATAILLPLSKLVIFDNDASNDATSTTYVYSDAAIVPAGWLDFGDPFGGVITAPVVEPNKTYRFDRDIGGADESITSVSFNRFIVSDVSNNQVASIPLVGGSTYSIDITLGVGDLAKGNLRFDVNYTGLYASSEIQILVDELMSGVRSGSFNIPLVESDFYLFSSSSKLATESPQLGFYTFRILVNPSSDGVFTLSARQAISSVDGLMLGKARTVTTLMSN